MITHSADDIPCPVNIPDDAAECFPRFIQIWRIHFQKAHSCTGIVARRSDGVQDFVRQRGSQLSHRAHAVYAGESRRSVQSRPCVLSRNPTAEHTTTIRVSRMIPRIRYRFTSKRRLKSWNPATLQRAAILDELAIEFEERHRTSQRDRNSDSANVTRSAGAPLRHACARLDRARTRRPRCDFLRTARRQSARARGCRLCGKTPSRTAEKSRLSFSSATARSSCSRHSVGVRSVQRNRPETTSSRPYCNIRRNASLASTIAPSRSQMKIPRMLASTRRRIFASRSARSDRVANSRARLPLATQAPSTQ